MKKPEILAPAGSVESVRAAVAAGCDAVYVGGSMFGARAFADNPDENSLIEVIGYCHLHGVRVYLTVNTLLKDAELEELLVPYLRPYYEAGLDAVIVQDFGVLKKIHSHFPDLAVHASTQMTVTGVYGAEFLRDHGVTRVVPARELTLEELKKMRENTSLEMEVFVHGALCYCYSGRCLLSSVNGGRSGNRGRCAQPCRLAYTCGKTGRTSYLFSPKELCSLEILPELIEAGVDSFKIEGRMKRAEYTGFTVYIYRKYRDLYLELGRESYRTYLETHEQEYRQDLENLMQMYNRNGFTHGYASGDLSDMLSDTRPNHNGIYIGKVIWVQGINARVKLEKDVYPQDGMVFRNEKGEEIYDYTAGEKGKAGAEICVHIRKGAGVKKGNALFRMKKGPLLQWIQEQFLTGEPQVEVAGQGVFLEGETICLRLQAKLPWGECTVEQEGDLCQSARQRPMKEEDIRAVLEKTGKEKFCFGALDIQVSENVFIPVGALKNLRRSAMEKLEREILALSARISQNEAAYTDGASQKPKKKHAGSVPEMIASVGSEKQLAAVLKSRVISTVILPVSYMDMESAISQAEKEGKTVYLRLPRVLRGNGDKELYQRLEEIFDGGGTQPSGVVIRNLEELYIINQLKDGGGSLSVMADFDLYVLNSGAAQWLGQQGVDRVTLSPELNRKEISTLSGFMDSKMCYTIYGYQELMVSAQCANRGAGICDGNRQYAKHNGYTEIFGKEGTRYLVRGECGACHSTVYSGQPVWMFSRWSEILQTDVSALRLDFVFEDERETEEILDILQGCMEGKVPAGNTGEYTGHFLRGVH